MTVLRSKSWLTLMSAMRQGLCIRAFFVATSVVIFSTLPTATTTATASIEDFSFSSMTVDYFLSRDAQGIAVLNVHERLEALFPEEDQNHGIVRSIPLSSHGMSTNPRITSVTDGQGGQRAFELTNDGEFLLVTIASDSFVHGTQVYDITYDETNVVSQPDGPAGAQELYLDVNGTGWSQPFVTVTGTLTVSPELLSSLNGRTACYKGEAGSTLSCDRLDAPEIAGTAKDTPTMSVEAHNLAAGETLTFAAGFFARTFVLPDMSFWAHPLAWPFTIAGSLMAALVLLGVVLRRTLWRNSRGRGTIIAEYEAPDGVDPLLAGDILNRNGRAIPAAILALAVRGRISIADREVGQAARGFDVELVSTSHLSPNEERTIHALFGTELTKGQRVDTSSTNASRALRLRSLRSETRLLSTELGFRASPRRRLRAAVIGATLIATAATFGFGLVITVDGHADAISSLVTFVATFIAVVTLALALGRVRPLTYRGALVKEHLRGLRLFIRLAEKDRISFLQSPKGAQRVTSGSSGSSSTTLRIYENALPYAVLFGLEREWSTVLAKIYADSSHAPDWYVGSGQFNSVAFAAGMNSFVSNMSTSWAQSGSSSSSAGSDGGGFAGGGGGGGGGGGV